MLLNFSNGFLNWLTNQLITVTERNRPNPGAADTGLAAQEILPLLHNRNVCETKLLDLTLSQTNSVHKFNTQFKTCVFIQSSIMTPFAIRSFTEDSTL
jgi:hypothetical protein